MTIDWARMSPEALKNNEWFADWHSRKNFNKTSCEIHQRNNYTIHCGTQNVEAHYGPSAPDVDLRAFTSAIESEAAWASYVDAN